MCHKDFTLSNTDAKKDIATLLVFFIWSFLCECNLNVQFIFFYKKNNQFSFIAKR